MDNHCRFRGAPSRSGVSHGESFTRGLKILVVLTACLSAGCATTAKISRFEAFAETGAQYATALDHLLIQAGTVLVDTNSEKLLQDVAELRAAGAPAELIRAELTKQDEPMRQNLTELDLLRSQVSLLADYFAALSRLATTEAPEALGDELRHTVESLNHLTTALDQSALFHREAGVAEVVQGVGTLAVRGVQLRALQRELEERQPTITGILRQHQALLAILEDQLRHDLELTQSQDYETKVVQPLVSGVDDREGWKASRLELLRRASLVQQVQDARNAAHRLQAAWAMLLNDKLGAADLQAVVDDLQPVLAGLAEIEREQATN